MKFSFLAVALLLGLPHGARADLLSRFHEKQVLRQTLAGTVEKVSFYAAALHETRTLFLYTPPGFASKPGERYPVLVLLHGSPGEPLDWLYRGEAHTAIDAAIRAGTLPPCLVAIPDGHGPFYKGGSEWADALHGRCNMESAIVRDLGQFLESRYRATTNPGLWAVGGLSEGGYGAANLTVRHPERFQTALVFSGDLRVKESWGDASAVFGTDPALRSANSPLDQLPRLPAGQRQGLHFYVSVGTGDDDDLLEDALRFTQVAHSAGATVRLDSAPGGHKWDFWSQHFRASLAFLGQWWKQVPH